MVIMAKAWHSSFRKVQIWTTSKSENGGGSWTPRCLSCERNSWELSCGRLSRTSLEACRIAGWPKTKPQQPNHSKFNKSMVSNRTLIIGWDVFGHGKMEKTKAFKEHKAELNAPLATVETSSCLHLLTRSSRWPCCGWLVANKQAYFGSVSWLHIDAACLKIWFEVSNDAWNRT